MSQKSLLGLTLTELQEVASELEMPKFAAKQMASWLYGKRIKKIEDMTNLSLKHRDKLSQNYVLGLNEPIDALRSVDGTVKYLFQVGSNNFIEAVYIPDEDRATLCVSSQVGCKMNCKFCMTGKQGFFKDLTAAEMLNQVFSIPESSKLTNLVLMGMGEPLDNLDEVLRFLNIMTSEDGCGWSPRRITLSTIGVRGKLDRFIKESECHLAISLHSAVPELRAQLMPVEKAYPITEMVKDLKRYDFSKQRRLSFEYIVFKDLNDSTLYAQRLIELLRGLPCRVNLIRYHAIPGIDLEGVSDERMMELRDYLTDRGLFTTIRASRGEDVFAACGMLSTEKKN
ncbi:MAG: 23S rRNA (adenine(2503)-C(2))-methyltransferase RlmN [Bacteroidales bacterium]|nr:23S rRNA (adenine(2503)-C(2))-methyltransferase RlmN [Bacteroidales bacterium]